MWIENLNSWMFELIWKRNSNILFWQKSIFSLQYCFIAIYFYLNIARQNCSCDASLNITFFLFLHSSFCMEMENPVWAFKGAENYVISVSLHWSAKFHGRRKPVKNCNNVLESWIICTGSKNKHLFPAWKQQWQLFSISIKGEKLLNQMWIRRFVKECWVGMQTQV